MEKNKTGKYFKYAIGEIVLVVIGILIALQINNWNENRKASNEEIKILNALDADFKVSKERIGKTLGSQSKVMSHSQALAGIYERHNKKEYQYFDTNLDSLSHLIAYSTSWYRAEPVTGAYNSLISAGKIDLIQNENLRNLLAQFIADFESGFEDQESSMKLLENLNNETSHFIFKIASNKMRHYLGYNSRKINSLTISETFFTNDSYFGNLFLKSIDEFNRLERQKQMLEQVNSILNIIKQELENKLS
ncbi:DUF6090 family protein [Psychroserpens ponticola]|uniref:DUF6090 family protein n=1 Tax=Psychroserpens ponticola TaxID=2932268 RepID=A0ABY7S3T3_9FLAO|nr:DUF6090 family protein [Psychroserpens ponticola]WCO03561.1 DUF6090 family protein [Psychroserpens ponticola]